MGKKAEVVLSSMDEMELVQGGAVSIQDLGIYDIEDWSGGFGNLYKEIKNVLLDGNRIRPELIPTVNHLCKESFCGSSPKILALAVARVGGQLAFMNIANERESNA